MRKAILMRVSIRVAKLSRLLLLITISLLVAITPSMADNGFDRGTPAESKGGLSALTSFAPDKIETVSLANGNLTVRIPLVTVGGRGSASYTVTLAYNSKVWTSQHDVEVINDPLEGKQIIHHYGAVFGDNTGRTPNLIALGSGWGILKGPAIKVNRVPINRLSVSCPNPGAEIPYQYILTRVWLILPDGSEVELRDNQTDGAPLHSPSQFCDYQVDGYRGRVWHSTDGSAITYITDVDNGVVAGNLNGWVFLSDGTRLRIAGSSSGRCTKIIDPNGNALDIIYDNPLGSVKYVDQLSREVIVQQIASGATVTIKGYGIADRTYTITTGQISSNLRSDYASLQQPFLSGDYDLNMGGGHGFPGPHTDLFWDDVGGVGSDIYMMSEASDQSAVTRLDLLDGRSFRFRYNPYGELAEIVYPAGGISQIDYGPYGTSVVCEAPSWLAGIANRGAIERRTLTDGSTVDAVWSYTDDSFTQGGQTYQGRRVEVRQMPSNTLLSSESHFFLALNAEYRTCIDQNSDGTTYEAWQSGKPFRVERRTGSGTQVEIRDWSQRTPVSWAGSTNYAQEQPSNDDRVNREDTILENNKLKRTSYTYDNFNNVTQVKEFDFGTNPNAGPLIRQLDRTYVTSLNNYCYPSLDGLASTCGPGVNLDPDAIIHMRRLLLTETISNGGAPQAFTKAEYDNYSTEPNHAPLIINSGMTGYNDDRFSLFNSQRQPRGNLTSVQRWISGSVETGVFATTFSQYDNAGNVVLSIDPKQKHTSFSYADNFGSGDNPDSGVAGNFGPTFAFPTTVTNPANHVLKSQYSFARGVPTGVKDPNGVITKTEYDAFDRPTRTTAALGLPEQTVTEFSYPTATANEAKQSSKLDATRWLSSRTQFDGFGRPVLASQSEDGLHFSTASFTIHTRTIYDGLGRAVKVTNPHRGDGASTEGWTRTTYDLVGRVTEVTTFEGGPGSIPPDTGTTGTGLTWSGTVLTTYSGNLTTVTDQAGKKRRSTTDGLGRLTQVDELNTDGTLFAATTYGYDSRGNLATVTQGAQGRSFSYDGLSRLTSATNPESGQIQYQYDLNSNLERKTDARGVITDFTYDDLNRVLTRAYSGPAPGGTTPQVTYNYDSATPAVPNSKGRLVSVTTTGVSTYSYTSYDAFGRVLGCSQATAGQTYTMSYTYDLAGNVKTETYPSGRKITNTFDPAGRLSQVSGEKTGESNKTYASQFTYTAHAAVKEMQLGNSKWEHTKHNSRLQPFEIGLGTAATDSSILRLDYTYGTSNNNGNVLTQRIVIAGSLDVTQSYSY